MPHLTRLLRSFRALPVLCTGFTPRLCALAQPGARSLSLATGAGPTPAAAPAAVAASADAAASAAAAADAAAVAAAPSRPTSLLQAYADLCKARLSALVVITSGAGFLLAGHPVDWVTFTSAVTGTALAAAAANTFNQVAEAPLDALMKRTQGRPLPTGRLSPRAALAFGGGATLASLGVLLAGTNPLTAALGMANIALYALVYTPLKQLSTLNTAVGAVVGAVPPLMGWAAATGSLLAVDPYLLAYTLFAWQFPHFYALAWNLRKDYARGGYHMVPVFDATGAHTARLIHRHTLVLTALPLLASGLGVTSPMYALEGLLLNGYLLRLSARFTAAPSDAGARAIFRASLWYLPLMAALLVFHANHWLAKEQQVQLDALVGAAPVGEQPELQRGTSWGEAAEHALATARLVGRELCLHELVAFGGGGGSSSSSSGRGGGRQPCTLLQPLAAAVAAAAAAALPALWW